MTCDGQNYWGPCTWQFMYYVAKNVSSSAPSATLLNDAKTFFVSVVPQVLPRNYVAVYQQYVASTPFPTQQQNVVMWVFGAHNAVRQELKQPLYFTTVARLDAAYEWRKCTANRTSAILPIPRVYLIMYYICMIVFAFVVAKNIMRCGKVAH